MKKTIIFSAVILVIQFLYGCIAFLPPYHKTSTETIIIVVEPEPIIIEPPAVIRPPADPPQTKPEKPVKEKRPQLIEKPAKDGDSGRDKSESLRNSGERKRR